MKPRIRSIKPDAHHDEGLWDLEVETGLPIFRGFVGLWSMADREGRFEWRPRALKSHILPYWDGDFARVLDACATRGFVRKYVVDGREYGLVVSFKKHQQINNREEDSTLPPPPDSDVEADTSTRAARVEDASGTRDGREGHAGKADWNRLEWNGVEGRVGDARQSTLYDARALTGLAALRSRATRYPDNRPMVDVLREGAQAAYRKLKQVAPPEAREPTWDGWARLEGWVIEKAELLGRDQRETARHLFRCFMRNKRAREKGYPIKFLIENGNEYWADELPGELQGVA